MLVLLLVHMPMCVCMYLCMCMYLLCMLHIPLSTQSIHIHQHIHHLIVAGCCVQGTPWVVFGEGLTETVRGLYAELINAESADCISLAPSTTFAISMAAKNIAASGRLGLGKKVLILDKEMASNVYPWQNVCQETGAELCIIPFPPAGESWASAILERLDDSVVVLSLGAVHWCDGSLIDVSLLSAELFKRFPERSQRPYFIIDGTQSIGAMHFNAAELQPDLACCSVHKWLLAGRGLSLVYTSPALHSTWLPLDHHDRTREGCQYSFWDNVGTMRGAGGSGGEGWVGYPEGFQRGARRLDAGGGHNYVQMAMLKESVSLLTTRWTPERIYPYLTYLSDTLANLVTAAFPNGPISVLPKEQRRGNILGIYVDPAAPWHVTPERIVDELKHTYNIHTVVRLGVIRISPYIMHNASDMHRTADSLARVVGSLQPQTRVLITGGTGWLAQHLYKALSPSTSTSNSAAGGGMRTACDVHVTSRAGTVRPHWLPESRCHVMELISWSDNYANEVIKKVSPHYIIHCAAVSAIAECESSPAAADANAPACLLSAIRKHAPDALLIFTSTDMVFAGRDAPYGPCDPRVADFHEHPPLCEYGKSKLVFEKMLVTLINNYVVLRLSNTMGPAAPFRPTGMKFLEFLENAAQNRKPIDLKNDELRSFVDVRDIIKVIRCIIETSDKSVLNRKVYNMGGPSALSRVDLAVAVAHARGIPIQVYSAAHQLLHSTTHQFEDSVCSAAAVPWKIHSVTLSEFLVRNPPSGAVVAVPKQVAMDSTATAAVFGIELASVGEMLGATRFL
jgi:selenocysteine lyase/cysteine desulfurase/dTDP-4-dehydrorhamnose reductase